MLVLIWVAARLDITATHPIYQQEHFELGVAYLWWLHAWGKNIIQCHDNNILKQMCIKNLCYSIETYLRYNVQGGETVQNIHVISTSRIVPIPKK